MGMMSLSPGEGVSLQTSEMVASRYRRADEMDAYERGPESGDDRREHAVPGRITWKKRGAAWLLG